MISKIESCKLKLREIPNFTFKNCTKISFNHAYRVPEYYSIRSRTFGGPELRPWIPYNLLYFTGEALYKAVRKNDSKFLIESRTVLPPWLRTLDAIPLTAWPSLQTAYEKDCEDLELRSLRRQEEIRKQRADLYLALRRLWPIADHEVFEFVKSLPIWCSKCEQEWMPSAKLKTNEDRQWSIWCNCGRLMADSTTDFESNIILEVHPIVYRFDSDSEVLDDRMEFTAHELETKYVLPRNLGNHTTWCIMMAKKEVLANTKNYMRQKSYVVVVRDTNKKITASCAINPADGRDDVGNYFSY